MLLGVHVSKDSTVVEGKSKSLESAIRRDLDELGLNAAQIFVSNPRNGIIGKLDYNAISHATADIDLTVHGSYNTVSVWKLTRANAHTPSSQRIIGNFTKQIIATKATSAWCLVIHISKVTLPIITETMHVLLPIAAKHKVTIGLEMISSKATALTTYETPEKINLLVSAINAIGPVSKWYGIVVDTSHIHGAGVNVQSYHMMSHWLDLIKEKKHIVMFHLNGSYAECGSGKDKHAIIFSPEDLIWNKVKPEASGVRAVVEYALKHNIVMIMEINRGSHASVVKAINIIKQLAITN
jgi:endonuclease IV